MSKYDNEWSHSPVIGGDETGIKINGKKGWLFTFQTLVLTFLSASLNRGFETINNLFKTGFPISVYVTNCLAAQLKVAAKARQICTAHLLRELNIPKEIRYKVKVKETALLIFSQPQPSFP